MRHKPMLRIGNTKEIINSKHETRNNTECPKFKGLKHWEFVRQLANCFGFRYSDFKFHLVLPSAKHWSTTLHSSKDLAVSPFDFAQGKPFDFTRKPQVYMKDHPTSHKAPRGGYILADITVSARTSILPFNYGQD